MALNTAFAVLPGLTIDTLPSGILDPTTDYVTGEEAISNALPAGYVGAFTARTDDDEDAVVLVGYELMLQPDLIPDIADEAVTAVFAGNSKTWLLIVDGDEQSRMLTLDASGVTAEDGEPVEGEPTAIIDGDPEKTLKQAVVDLTGIDLDAVVADKGVLVIVED
ncbi:hypothetical protein [Dermacoccus barathri]|jgi:hypothetical protein|uniref:Uncharacterized protein n=1 Tax=Dermacoccus abyssi TaxID=322596 RepID=A0ABX5Z8Z1_9MICO|nr:hypothetical protein [Dermacoccus barathri]MBE7370681.1 hypothetical protein [Dermacoccus barathri]QEH92230.1 hypothetical protein FV141_00750 [Dermacoccus abyssi]